jgi:FdhE protein
MSNIEKIITELEKIRSKKPDLADTINLHHAILKQQRQIEPLSFLMPPAEQIEVALQQKISLCHFTTFLNLDDNSNNKIFRESAVEICHIMAEHRPDLVDDLRQITDWLGQIGNTIQLVEAYLKDTEIDTPPVDTGLLIFVINQVMRPFLWAYADAFNPIFRDELWGQAICPMCAGSPDFAAIVSSKDNNYGRTLLCQRCDMEWGYQRKGCPFCEQPESWSYFSDKFGVFRLYVCDSCQHYLKTVDWRETFTHRLLPVARIITLDMDVTAIQAGYVA